MKPTELLSSHFASFYPFVLKLGPPPTIHCYGVYDKRKVFSRPDNGTGVAWSCLQ